MNVKKILMWFMVLVFVVGLGAVGFAGEKKSNATKKSSVELVTAVDELDCGQTKIVAETTCTADSKRTYKICTGQTISFKDMKRTGKIIKKIHNENLSGADERVGKNIDAFMWNWACVQGISEIQKELYLLVGLSTGGNCDMCEWYEIYKMNGEKIASSRGKVTSKAHKNFEKVYKQLGFPEKWHDISFSQIKILKNQE